jgi:hypothetical protein
VHLLVTGSKGRASCTIERVAEETLSESPKRGGPWCGAANWAPSPIGPRPGPAPSANRPPARIHRCASARIHSLEIGVHDLLERAAVNSVGALRRAVRSELGLDVLSKVGDGRECLCFKSKLGSSTGVTCASTGSRIPSKGFGCICERPNNNVELCRGACNGIGSPSRTLLVLFTQWVQRCRTGATAPRERVPKRRMFGGSNPMFGVYKDRMRDQDIASVDALVEVSELILLRVFF